MNINIPHKVKSIMNYLEGFNFGVLVVVGCVRDSLIGKEPNDWDMCTNRSPEEIMDVLKDKYTVIPTGIKHGTVSVVIDKEVYEITTYRKEEGYSDSRHPDSVSFVSNLDEDLKRRDFTINAMAYNDKSGLVDLYGGVSDLEKGIIRCVGSPVERFSEDALRILRGIRFSARLGFPVEEETEKGIFKLKENLKSISAERIFEELKGIILCEKPYKTLLKYKPVIDVILYRNIDISRLEFIDSLPLNLNLRLASLLLQLGCEDASEILRNLKSDTKTKKAVCTLIENKDIILPKKKSDAKHLLKRFGKEILIDILIFSKEVNNIDDDLVKESLSLIDEVVSLGECYSLSQLKISGVDLLERGYKGKDIRLKLEEMLNMVIDGKVKNEKADLISHL